MTFVCAYCGETRPCELAGEHSAECRDTIIQKLSEQIGKGAMDKAIAEGRAVAARVFEKANTDFCVATIFNLVTDGLPKKTVSSLKKRMFANTDKMKAEWEAKKQQG